MDGVAPYSQSTINRLRESIREKDEDHQKRVDELKKKNEEEVDRLQANNEKKIRELERSYNKTVEKAKDGANQVITDLRRSHKSELENIKRDQYDSRGRIISSETATLKDQLAAANEAVKAGRAKNDDALEFLKKNQDRRVKQLYDDFQSQTEQDIKKARTAARKSYDSQLEKYKGQDADYRDRLERKYNAAETIRVRDELLRRRESERAIEDAERDYEYRKDKFLNSKYEEGRQEQQIKAIQEKAIREVDRARQNYRIDTARLRKKVKEATENTTRNKSENQTRADIIREYSSDWRKRLADLEEAQKKEVFRLKNEIKETEEDALLRNEENTRSKEAHFQELVRKQQEAAWDQQKRLKESFQVAQRDLEKRLENEKDSADKRVFGLGKKLNEETQNKLEDQATLFKKSFAHQSALYGDKIKNLENELHHTKTTDDIAAVSPNAEKKIREGVISEYEKLFEIQRKKTNEASTDIRDKYSGELQSTRDEFYKRENEIKRNLLGQLNTERQVFLDQMRDVKESKERAIQELENSHARQIEKLNKNFDRMLNKQRETYEELLANTRTDAQIEMAKFQQQAEFNKRMAHKEANSRFSESAREYERKLTSLKGHYEEKLARTKSEADAKIRHIERSMKSQLDTLAVKNEEYIKQLEFRQKKREADLLAGYEDKLDRLRVVYAERDSKKS